MRNVTIVYCKGMARKCPSTILFLVNNEACNMNLVMFYDVL